ncbi:MAG: hypothetical protein ACKO13_01125, partial [Cytophagales bacterium]
HNCSKYRPPHHGTVEMWTKWRAGCHNGIIHREVVQLPPNSEPYYLMNAQVTKDIGTQWSVYVGGENLNNFTVNDPIVAASAPFGPHFDSAMVWGPVFGTIVYAGFRYRVK